VRLPSDELRCPYCGETRALDTWQPQGLPLEVHCQVCGRMSGEKREAGKPSDQVTRPARQRRAVVHPPGRPKGSFTTPAAPVAAPCEQRPGARPSGPLNASVPPTAS